MARRHEVNANQVFYWRKQYREGQLGITNATPLLPVKVKTERPTKMLPADVVLGHDGNKALERNTAHRSSVDVPVLRAVLECLAR